MYRFDKSYFFTLNEKFVEKTEVTTSFIVRKIIFVGA